MLSLHRAIETQLPGGGPRTLLFLAARSQEGTTTIVQGFARLLTRRLRVPALVIDADPWPAGGGPVDLEALVGRGGGVDDLVGPADGAALRVPVSRRGTPAAAVLGSDGGRGVLKQLADRFGRVLIDAPAVSVASDSVDLVALADGIVLVVEAENTPWPLVRDLRDRVVRRGGALLGLVLNKRRRYLP
jgi:hypothetical protein